MYPFVMNVHRLVQYISIDIDIKAIKYCENCGMCEWAPNYSHSFAMRRCENCNMYTAEEDIPECDPQVYLNKLLKMPLRFDGKIKWDLECSDKATKQIPFRSYKDLSNEEITELDLIA